MKGGGKMKTTYIVYWYLLDGLRKHITTRDFNSLEEAETFAKEKLTDCVYTIRKVKESK